MENIICGIQQMGIGVPDVQQSWKWYRKFFGVNVRVFEDAAEAPLMTRYTGGVVQSRTATLALSMEGGGGFEIWQFTSRGTEKATFDIRLGDYGLYACKIKSRNVRESYNYFKENGANIVGELQKTPNGEFTFYVQDPNGNIFQIVEGKGWFRKTNHPSNCGGVAGSVIAVSDIDAAIILYRDVLKYDKLIYDQSGEFEDFSVLPAGSGKFRRVLLGHNDERTGPFSKLLGPTQIELVQALDRTDCRKIFENRFWGDWGFIHLCFDVQGMDDLKKKCQESGFPFTVDSSDSFDMGKAAGRFAYVEDPDGTLIELVETHKVPIMKKLGWYINLKNRPLGKRLPDWILRAMGLSKVRG